MVAHILTDIQNKLKAPKNQFNTFGKYNYRNCEDILDALKPHLERHGAFNIIQDDIVLIGDRHYVKATAILYSSDGTVIASATAFAREPESRKGMDEAQLTGATSSYARKYALNGLYAIDDSKDADSMKNNGNDKEPAKEAAQRKTQAGESNKDGFKQCPSCGAEAIIKNKKEYGGGWVCWRAKKGCGKKFEDEALTKELDSNFRFLETMQGLKKQILDLDGNTKVYYEAIGALGYEKSNEITKRTEQDQIYLEMLKYIERRKKANDMPPPSDDDIPF